MKRPLEDVVPRMAQGVSIVGSLARGFPEVDCDGEAEEGCGKCRVDGPAHGVALGGFPSRPLGQGGDKVGVKERGAGNHGEEEAGRLPSHERFENAGPCRMTVILGQGIVGQRLIGTARAGLGRAA